MKVTRNRNESSHTWTTWTAVGACGKAEMIFIILSKDDEGIRTVQGLKCGGWISLKSRRETYVQEQHVWVINNTSAQMFRETRHSALIYSIRAVWQKPSEAAAQTFVWSSVMNFQRVCVCVFALCGWCPCSPQTATLLPLQLWLTAQHEAGTDTLQCLGACEPLLTLLPCFPARVTDADLWLELEVFLFPVFCRNELWSWMINSAISGKNEGSRTPKFCSHS